MEISSGQRKNYWIPKGWNRQIKGWGVSAKRWERGVDEEDDKPHSTWQVRYFYCYWSITSGI